jgi:hypothetical protein
MDDFAQAADVGINGPVIGIVISAECLIDNLIPRENHSGLANQRRENQKLGMAQ